MSNTKMKSQVKSKAIILQIKEIDVPNVNLLALLKKKLNIRQYLLFVFKLGIITKFML